MTKCIFCDFQEQNEILFNFNYFYAMLDNYPVTEYHTLIISRTHKETFFDLSTKEKDDLMKTTEIIKYTTESKDHSITGWNIGMNCGKSSGQTVPHFHLHMIPRRDGDMENPKGGVRGVIPHKQKY